MPMQPTMNSKALDLQDKVQLALQQYYTDAITVDEAKDELTEIINEINTQEGEALKTSIYTHGVVDGNTLKLYHDAKVHATMAIALIDYSDEQ